MDHHTNPWPDSKSLYLLRGIAGAPVGAKIADAPEFHFPGVGTVIGAILGAAFFVIGRRQLQRCSWGDQPAAEKVSARAIAQASRKRGSLVPSISSPGRSGG